MVTTDLQTTSSPGAEATPAVTRNTAGINPGRLELQAGVVE
jgi:hypothetical protein